MFSGFKTSYRTTVIKAAQYWYKYRQIDQWNEPESLDMNPYIYEQKIFDKGAKNTEQEKDSLFSKWCWENQISICQRINLDHIQKLTQMDQKPKSKT